MAQLTDTDGKTISDAVYKASDWVTALDSANAVSESEQRKDVSKELLSRLENIVNVGFYDKTDFTDQEISTLRADVVDINDTAQAIQDSHELTLMELATDLAEVIQKLSLGEYDQMLRLSWISERRQAGVRALLPQEIPDEVRDDYAVALFTMVQGSLNQSSNKVQAVKEFRCLNSEDYSTQAMHLRILEFGALSARIAMENYVELQSLRAAAAKQEDDGPGVLGTIWSVIGWDSPTDFLKDMVVVVVTGGASKVARWAGRLAKTAKRFEKFVGVADKFLEIEGRLEKATKRLSELAVRARNIRTLKRMAQLEQDLFAFFNAFKEAEKQVELIKKAGEEVTAKSLRGMVSTMAARLATSQNLSAGSSITNELARLSAIAWLDGTPLSDRIKLLKETANLQILILSRFSGKIAKRFMEYFILLLAREFLVRLALAVIRKVKLTREIATNEFISAFGAALDTAFTGIPLIEKSKVESIVKTLASSLRKVVVSMGQELAKPLVA